MKTYPLHEILIADSLKEQVKHYGIEGLEDAIKRTGKTMPKLCEMMLKEYNKMYKKDLK